ncbi:hypothetical protein DPX16_14467 [Anabarilius grahami]|uniref:Uncharacterized protein n=1 Tax=Anabarilius grahami TaxID=495550 RepID=A0A3N0YX98_ANAGA|nr:hypothetical protein DPX16_14467 [Anabarilius grahami]
MDERAIMLVRAQESPDLFSFVQDFIFLAVTSTLDDQSLKTLFRIRVTFHQPLDLPDTTGLNWREAVIRCLESVAPRSGAQPDPEPVATPSTAENSRVPSADGEPAPATTRQPEPEEERTELTLVPDVPSRTPSGPPR